VVSWARITCRLDKGTSIRATRALAHPVILDAAAVGDDAAAAELLTRHYLHTVRLVFEVLDPDRELARLRRAVATAAPGAVDVLDSPRIAPRRARRVPAADGPRQPPAIAGGRGCPTSRGTPVGACASSARRFAHDRGGLRKV
jgi:hypothetical protein